MIKHFYFGLMTPEDVAETQGAFFFAGQYWYFYMEVNLAEGHVRITDVTGRILPVDQEHLQEMIIAADNAIGLQDRFNDLMEEVEELDENMHAAGFVAQGCAEVIISESN